MTNWSGAVGSEHLGAEGVLLDMGDGVIMSDHPKHYGGSAKGPTPGELMWGGLASSIALALGAAADHGELPIRSIAVRCSNLLDYQPADKVLPTLLEKGRATLAWTFMPEFVVDLMLVGDLTPDQVRRAEAIARDSQVARTLAGDLDIEETNAFAHHDVGSGPRGPVGVLMETRGQSHYPRKDPVESRERSSTVHIRTTMAEYLGGGRALVSWSGSPYVVEATASEEPGNGKAPEALVLASLSACTMVYTARAVEMVGAKADLRIACEGEFDSSSATPARIRKRLTVTGDLNADQREAVAHFADHCAFGLTLKRRARLNIDIRCAAPAGAGGVGAGAIGEARAMLQQAPDCDDGLCCVPPDVASQTAATK